jgi:hypothetical protein
MSVINLPTQEAFSYGAGHNGIVVNPNEECASVTLTMPSADDLSTAYVRDANGNTLTSKDISGVSEGESFTIDYTFSAGTDYQLTVNEFGHKKASASYPYTSTHFDVVTGISGGSTDSTVVKAWRAVEMVPPVDPPSTPQNVSVTQI